MKPATKAEFEKKHEVKDPVGGNLLRKLTLEYELPDGSVRTHTVNQVDGEPTTIEVEDGVFQVVPNPKRYVTWSFHRDVDFIWAAGQEKDPTMCLPTGKHFVAFQVVAGCDFLEIKAPFEKEENEEAKPAVG